MKFFRPTWLRDFLHFFRLASHYARGKLFLFVALNYIAVLFESIGIFMFVPFLKELNVTAASNDRVSRSINAIFNFFGLSLSIGNILTVLVLCMCAKGIVLFFVHSYRSALVVGISKQLREDLIQNYADAEYLHAASRSSGNLSRLVIGDLGRGMFAFETFCRILTSLATVSTLVSAALTLQPQLSVLLLIAGLMNSIVFQYLVGSAKELSREESRHGVALTNYVNALFNSFKYLKATDRFEPIMKRIRDTNQTYLKCRIRSGMANAAFSAARDPTQAIFLAGIIYYQVVILGQSVAPILVSLLLFQRCLVEMSFLQRLWHALWESSAGLENLHESELLLKKQKEEIHLGAQPYFNKSISLQDVHFSYGGEEVLKGVSLEIPHYSSIAFVGRSGTGKTTLVDILAGLLKPQKGSVFIDGVDLAEIDLHRYRKKIGYVSQNTVIFLDTIANNISLDLGSHPDEVTLKKIKRAATLAHVDEFAEKMPRGYLQLIGDGENGLSGGQKQRIAIARELYRNPEILILDESTNSLDSVTEAFIQEHVRELQGAATVIIISHRLSTVRDVNHICVIDQGRIVERGTYRELASNSQTIFRSIYDTQNAVNQ